MPCEPGREITGKGVFKMDDPPPGRGKGTLRRMKEQRRHEKDIAGMVEGFSRVVLDFFARVEANEMEGA